MTPKKRTAVFWLFILAVLGLGLASCGSSGKSKEFQVTFQKEESCRTIDAYTVLAKSPYDTSFSAAFQGTSVTQEWPEMPEGEIQLEIRLDGSDASIGAFAYRPTISRDWGESAVFSLQCDDANPKPVLLLDMMKIVSVVTIRQDCIGWFDKVSLYEEVVNSSSGSSETGLVLSGSAVPQHAEDQGRSLFYLRETNSETPTFQLWMEGIDGKTHKFRYVTDSSWGQEYDFTVTCDQETEAVDSRLTVGEHVLTPGGEDGDIDGDDDEGETDSPDGDDDGDTDGDLPADGDLDQPTDGDDTESESSDGDAESETVETEPDLEAEPDTACGTEDPEFARSLEAETAFIKTESHPTEKANVITTENAQISGGQYVRLDAEEVGGELVFEFEVPAHYEYQLYLYFVGGKDYYGRVSVFLDDGADALLRSNGSAVIDLEVQNIEEFAFPMESYRLTCLTAGMHRLRVRVVDSGSSGYKAGLDKFWISSDF